jgi:hypothetical protein
MPDIAPDIAGVAAGAGGMPVAGKPGFVAICVVLSLLRIVGR